MNRYILWGLLFCAGLFTGCDDEEEVAVIEVSKLEVNTPDVSLRIGEKVRLQTVMTPVNATDTVIVWTSDQPEIATVDGHGVITALKKGAAKIAGKVGSGYAEVAVNVSDDKTTTLGLVLSKEELSLVEKDTFSLTFEVYPELDKTKDEIVWTTSDEGIATVDAQGKITAVHAGTAIIGLKAGMLETSCKLTVYERFEAAESIAFELKELKLNVDETLEVKVKITPEDATERNVKWSVADESFATVHEGKVTGVFGGTTTLRAEINDSVWCEMPIVIVQPVESIRFYTQYKEIGEGGTFTLRPTIEPYNATDQKVGWSSSDEKVATVEEKDGIGVVKALVAGKAVIKAVCGGKEATCEVVVSEDKGTPLDIPDANFLEKLLLDCDVNGNGRITDDEAEKVADLDLWYEDIASLKGIEYFKYLRILDARRNALTEVDLSKNLDLEELKIGENPLTTLDLKANTKLLLLDIEKSEKIQSIDLSANKQLASFSAANSPIFVLGNISHLENLQSLSINGTATKSLDVTHNLKLKSLYCGGVQEFMIIGLEKLLELKDFYLYDSSALEVIDLSNASKIEYVQIQGKHPKLTKLILPKDFKKENLTCPSGVTIEYK